MEEEVQELALQAPSTPGEGRCGSQMLRAMTSVPVDLMPAGQGSKVGRCRWQIENGTFTILARDNDPTHDYRHSVRGAALVGQPPRLAGSLSAPDGPVLAFSWRASLNSFHWIFLSPFRSSSSMTFPVPTHRSNGP